MTCSAKMSAESAFRWRLTGCICTHSGMRVAGSGVEFHFLLVSLVWFLYRCFLMSSQPAAQRLLTPHGACYTSRRSHAPSRATPRSTSRHAPHTHPARPASVSKHRLLLATLQLCISKHVLGVSLIPFSHPHEAPVHLVDIHDS